MPDSTVSPVRIAIVNDYEVVVAGLARMLEPFEDRVQVVEIEAGKPVAEPVDVALYDTFGQVEGSGLDRDAVLSAARASHLVVYTWNTDPQALREVMAGRADGFVPKHTSAEDLVGAVERVRVGERVVLPTTPEATEVDGADWPGRQEGLSARESEIVALIVQGLSNEQVAGRAFLSINTIKSYIRSAYRKMGVTSRSQAVLWGVDHGFRPASSPDGADRDGSRVP